MDDPTPGPDLTPVIQRPSQTMPDNSKPILILVCLQGMHIQVRFQRMLSRLERDAELRYARDVSAVDKILRENRPSVAGIIVTDARIMDPKYEFLASCLASLPRSPVLNTESPTAVSAPIPIPTPANNPQMNMAHRPQNFRGVPSQRYGQDAKYKTIPLVFAFDFPAQAARHPLNFTRFIRRTFGLPWRITGKTLNKIKLGLRQRTLRKMDSARQYRTQYEMQAVFLRGVKLADKVLVATGEFAPGGQPENEAVCGKGYTGGWGGVMAKSLSSLSSDGGDDGDEEKEREEEEEEEEEEEDLDDEEQAKRVRLKRGHRKALDWLREQSSLAFSPPSPPGSLSPPADEIPSEHANENEDDNKDETTQVDDELEFLTLNPLQFHPRVQAMLARRPLDKNVLPDPRKANWVPSDDEGTIADLQIADCPVAIHEIKNVLKMDGFGAPVVVRGYVGFVGHVTDSRTLGSLILGMCAVSPFVKSA